MANSELNVFSKFYKKDWRHLECEFVEGWLGCHWNEKINLLFWSDLFLFVVCFLFVFDLKNIIFNRHWKERVILMIWVGGVLAPSRL